MSLSDLSEVSEGEYEGRERRNSVRARAMLPCQVERIEREDIPELESYILDTAVLDAEHAHLNSGDWAERADELSREMIFVLTEIRALRQQLTDIQRAVELSSRQALTPRWVVINDRGLWLPQVAPEEDIEEGCFVKVQLQIPSLASPQILALGEVIRVRERGASRGIAIEFRSISSIHSKAIIRYALRRERQLARSKLFSSVNL